MAGDACINTHHICVEKWDGQKSLFHVPLPTTAPSIAVPLTQGFGLRDKNKHINY